MAMKLERVLESLPPSFSAAASSGVDGAWLLSCPYETLCSNASGQFQPKGMKRWLALHRKSVYWIKPSFGKQAQDVPSGTQLLLWEKSDGSFGALIPLVDGDLRATLEGGDQGLRLVWEGQLPGDEPESAVLAVVAAGRDPYALVESAMRAAKAKLRSFRMREEKKTPAFVDYLGWCTWDAFYQEVDAGKTLAGIASFAKRGLAPGFVVLDDGWLDVDNLMMLNSFSANELKFPGGLASLIEKAKGEYGVKLFGVWHAFQGYWSGVAPSGPAGLGRNCVPNLQVYPPPPGESKGKEQPLSLVDPAEAARFYNEFHRALWSEGVDMVKVDNQSSLINFIKGECGLGSSMRLYQEALQGSVANYFLGNSVHCMSNSSDVAFNMSSATVFRNSDDYFPKQGPDAQQTHVFVNAMNALWTSTFSLPDWDMFQSHGPCPELHAAARAISGGPVYLCDKPGMQNFEIVSKLAISGSKALRFDRPALPCLDSLFSDSLVEDSVLKVWNKRASIGVLGLFHCQHGGSQLPVRFAPSDVPGLEGSSFAAYCHSCGELNALGPDDQCELSLDAASYEIVTLSPIDAGLAPLGLLGKYAGAAALLAWGWASKGVFECSLSDGGLAGFFSKKRPASVSVSGKKVPFNHDKSTALLTVSLPEGGPVKALVSFA